MKYARAFLLSLVIMAGTSCERHDAKVLEAFEHGEAHSATHDEKPH